MIRVFLIVSFCQLIRIGWCQEYGFDFGDISPSDLRMTQYDKDTSANAVYLKEFGEAHIDSENDHNLIFEYHAVIKILRPEGLDEANRSVMLYAASPNEQLYFLKASTYNLENGEIVTTSYDPKSLFTERVNNHWEKKSFTFPNAHTGSVLEFEYTIESPYYYTFRRWEFQGDIPKVSSEYWATIPANFIYNITLVGFLKLTKNEGSIIKNCFNPQGNTADCARFKYEIDDVPAFVKEDYMTAPENFLSALNFEITEIRFFNGETKKYTLTWEDAEHVLDRDDDFGVQLNKGKDILKEMSPDVYAQSDSLLRARAIFNFMKNHFKWNEDDGKYSEQGIKKAYDNASGNVGDINLSLIAVLQAAGLNAVPLILSTRDHRVPFEENPLLTDYNYVIAMLHVNGQAYLLDATDPELPFGMIPERCLNGKGRALAKGGSYWYPLNPGGNSRTYCGMDIAMNDDGNLVGKVTRRYTGYAAYDKRKELDGYASTDGYVKALESSYGKASITDFTVTHRDSLDQALIETFQISMEGMEDANSQVVLLNPFLVGHIKSNPFKLKSRQYPIDYGISFDQTFMINIRIPNNYQVENVPEALNLVIPGNGAHYASEAEVKDNTLKLSYLLSIAKPVFPPNEYDNLKEFYSRIVQSQNTDLVLKTIQ